MASIFKTYHDRSYPHRFAVTLHCHTLAGQTPSDQHVTEGWLKSKMGETRDDIIRAAAAEIMVERGIELDEATKLVDELRHLNGFKRDEQGLYLDGNSAKAMLKEAVSVAIAADKIDMRGWGTTKKFLTNYFPEHVFVIENRVHVQRDGAAVTEPDGVNQRFVHTFRGASIQYEEFCTGADLPFTVETDHDFSDDFWAAVWTTGEMQGIGASRSQGFGRFDVVRWERLIARKAHPAAKVAPMPPVERPKKASDGEAAADGNGAQPRGRKASAAKG